MIELIGVLGAIAFSVCALPQAITTYKQGNTKGVSTLFLLLWLFGEIATIVYVYNTSGDSILMANYIVNLMSVLFILRYWILPRRNV